MRLLTLALIACKGGTPTDPATQPSTGTDTDLPPDFGGNEGGLALLRTYAYGQLDEARVVGVFTNDAQGFVNLAQCATDPDAVCLRALPDLGTQLPFQPIDRFVPDSSFYQHVGLRVRFGPYQTLYEVGDDLSFYDVDITEDDAFEGPARIKLDVEWGPFDQEAVVDVPGPFTLISPFADTTTIVFSDDTEYPLIWIADPENDADVIITIRNVDPDEEGRVLRVPDTGNYALDLTSLDIQGDQELVMTIGRWTVDTIDVNGNDLILQTTAESVIDLDYRDVGLRTPVQVPGSCEIEPMRLPLGRYYGDISLHGDDHQEVICLQSFDAANGSDGVFTLSIPPRTRTDLEYRQLDANASMYLLDGCDPGSTCVLGADTNTGQGPETMRVFNRSDTEFEKYTLVLDAADPFTGGLFFIDHERTVIPEPEWGDSCLDALGLPSLPPGDYFGPDLSHLQNSLDPGFTGCTGTALPGPDGLIPVDVPAGGTLEVTMSMEGDNPALYLLADCSDLSTCLQGVDQPGDVEALVYANPTGADQTVFLVLDSFDTSGPYFLSVRVN